MSKVTFRKQTTEDNCTSACLAMILHKDVYAVYSEFHGPYFNDRITAAAYLMERGYQVREPRSSDRRIEFGNIYILCVPSLNMEAIFHSVVADTTGDTLEVFDPSMGWHGRKYYTYEETTDPMAVQLRGYCIDVEVIGGPIYKEE